MNDHGSNSDFDDHVLSRKRRRYASESTPDNDDNIDSAVRQLLAEEFDLEIALRQRLAATIESRINWALLLQDSLAGDYDNLPESPPLDNFQDAAMDALDAVDSHSAFLFDRELSYDTPEPSSRSFSPFVPAPPQVPARVYKPRHASSVRLAKSNVKLVFIQDTTVDPPVIAKMSCPDCGRFDFTNLQGLLNHCRLRHKRDFGTHDECMQKCAVIVPEEDQDWVMTHGTELSGVSLPSLRRLFEIAVGTSHDRGNPERPQVPEPDDTQGHPSEENSIPSTLLSRTLGLHIDTPALAPFLGRAPKRRCINVHDGDEVEVDIMTLHETSPALSPSSWRMTYPHRNTARPSLDMMVESSIYVDLKLPASSNPSSNPSASTTAGTRFHFTTRVQISDRSLWLPPSRRLESRMDHSHRWMIGITSPSYSLHITAFLAQITVTCLTNPPPSTFTTPLTISGPPFVVMGTTDRPFLVRLTLVWAGKQNPPMDVEHWVELDPFKSGSATLGEEQIIDVELDRNTDLLPVRSDLKLPTLERDATKGSQDAAPDSFSDSREAGYVSILRSLLPRVPLTMKDAKGRSLPQVPYKLVATPAQLCNLIPGRRKAIEWGRARALREAYEHRAKLSPSIDAIPLTTGDVYCWLEDEGHFIRPSPGAQPTVLDNRGVISTRSPQDEYCSVCGIKRRLHPSFNVKSEFSSTQFVCDIVTNHTIRPSYLDMNNLFNGPLEGMIMRTNQASPGPPPSSVQASLMQANYLSRYSPRDFISIAQPAMTLAVRRTVRVLGLPSFTESTPGLLQLCSNTRTTLETHLAPYSLLAASVESLVAVLVRRGLDVAKHDVARALPEGRKKAKSRLLTPSHIIRGLQSGITIDPTQTAVLLSLARLAVPISFGRHLSAEQAPFKDAVVKLEPE
ncbi:hypothetical protein BV22DRAFT_1130736 [Leucogyrophana mollusca]|uniref:Uncharacterized protein n=1 Tax=Leucogyrophana mollusca TaxID=85980 RepID=A0ACB8BDU2_9AGAM|nr:hypothetical protein BV22DRAFT_1130736 [Leucogyrophana mollusca]